MDENIENEICSLCNGKKYIPDGQYNTRLINVNIGGFSFTKHSCPKCDGNGVVNWIDNVIESNEENNRKKSGWYRRWNYKDNEKTWKHWSDKSKR